jgi:hypothetical protein
MFNSSTENLDITLFRGWSDTGRYVWSPFVTKLELRCRLAGISYHTAAGSVKTAPTGKIPYVELKEKDTLNTMKVGDSGLIAKYFIECGFMNKLDAGLDASVKAHDLAIRALIEDRLYFFNACFMHSTINIYTDAETDAGTLDRQFLHPT